MARSGPSRRQLGQAVLYAAFAFGWLLLLVSTFLINHFDLFGLRQVWLQLLGKPYRPLQFGTPVLYRYVRHPLYVGWFFVFWATPTMTVTHLVFAIATTAYILIAIQLEERDLIDCASRVRGLPSQRADADAVHQAPPAGIAASRFSRAAALSGPVNAHAHATRRPVR